MKDIVFKLWFYITNLCVDILNYNRLLISFRLTGVILAKFWYFNTIKTNFFKNFFIVNKLYSNYKFTINRIKDKLFLNWQLLLTCISVLFNSMILMKIESRLHCIDIISYHCTVDVCIRHTHCTHRITVSRYYLN